jgi:hypothetical protein
MKFIVYTYGWSEQHGGINVLHELIKRLLKHGADVSNYIEGSPVPELSDDTIAIYPEIVGKNPLNAKRVVRWILYGSTSYHTYDPNEITYYHAPFCKNNPAINRLNCLYLPPGAKNLGLPRIHNACYVVKKGNNYQCIRDLLSEPLSGSLEDKARNHAELIRVFNTTRYFYCYDPCCFLILLALMCGCIVVQYPVDNLTEEEWIYTIGITKLPGLAYGATNLPYAEATIQHAYPECMKLIDACDDHVKKFIEDIKTSTFSTDPCYKFNDSPFSLQHKYRA